MNDFIKENGGPIAIAVIALAIGTTYLEWRIDVHTTKAISNAGAVTPAQLALLQKDVETIGDAVEDNKIRHDRTDTKLDRIIDILLEE